MSIYSVWDMLRYNRARRAEWVEAQKRLEADELATARLAYLKGKATEEQIMLVEEANREAERTGVKLPPLLAPPEHRTHFEENVEKLGNQSKGILGFFGLGGSKDEGHAAASSDAASSGDASRTIEDKAKQAWENQRRGGSLDQLGLETGSQEPKKKGWWLW